MKITLQCQNLKDNINKYVTYLNSLPSILDVNVLMPEEIIILNVKDIKFIASLEKFNIKIKNCTVSYQNFDINMLEYMNNIEEKDHEIIRENDNFNLKDFYLNKLNGAVCVITKKDIVFSYAIYDHSIVTNAIYNYLYNNLNEEEYFHTQDSLWQQKALKYGNIIIQFCSDSPSIIWLPTDINEFQNTALNFIQNNIQNIQKQYGLNIETYITSEEELYQEKHKTV